MVSKLLTNNLENFLDVIESLNLSIESFASSENRLFAPNYRKTRNGANFSRVFQKRLCK